MRSSDAPIQAHKIRCNNETVTYFTAGQSSGVTIVLVHGIGVSTRYFRSLITALAPNFRILSVDLPGFGASSRPEKAWAIPDFAQAVQAVIDHEHILHPVLLGQSMGCQVIASLLAQQPGISPKAILIGPTVDAKHRSLAAQTWRLLQDSILEPPLVNLRIWREYARCGPKQYLQTVRPMLRDRIEDNLAASEAAVLIVRGEHDVIAPHAWAGKLAAVAPAAGRCEIKGAAHLAHMTHTDEIAVICEEFALA